MSEFWALGHFYGAQFVESASFKAVSNLGENIALRGRRGGLDRPFGDLVVVLPSFRCASKCVDGPTHAYMFKPSKSGKSAKSLQKAVEK